jgi:hypothetical protein
MLTLTTPKNNAVPVSIIATVLFGPAETKRHGWPNSQKKSESGNRFTLQLVISGNTACQKGGEPPARPVFDGNIQAESRLGDDRDRAVAGNGTRGMSFDARLQTASASCRPCHRQRWF